MKEILFPINATYTITVILVGIFLIPFIWIGIYAAVNQLGEQITDYMEDYSDTENYNVFQLTSTFMKYLWKFMLAFFIFGLIVWAIIYSQRKGRETI